MANQDSSDKKRRSGGRRSDQGRGGRSRGYRRSYQSRRKVCAFCVDQDNEINWKNVDNLRRFINDSGDIRSRRKTGTCARHQRRLAIAIKRARHMAMLPYTMEHMRTMRR